MRLQSVDAGRFCVLLKQLMSYGFLVLLLSLTTATRAQCPFNSGSTGSDGAFAPTASQEVQVPESGVFNFTTVDIPAGVTITFRRNSRNTPVTILAQGNVTISGKFDVSGTPGGLGRFQFGRGGPGGFDGGGGGFPVLSTDPLFKGVAGDGPGGGGGSFNAWGGGGGSGDPGQNGFGSGGGSGGPRYGSPSLLPLIGGSGGGGGSSIRTAGAGGGGGGALLIASSGAINFNATSSVLASGSSGGIGSDCTFFVGGGGGGGGSIRLIASSITGSTFLIAGAGGGVCGSGAGGRGYVRVEACSNTLTISSTAGLLTFGKPSSVTLPNAPQLQIVSVAGVNAPANPSGSFNQTPDVTLQASTPNPVSISLQAANIPVGTVAQVSIQPESGARTTVPSTPLAGTISSSTATASATLPTGLSLIYSTAEFDITTTASAKPFFIDGEQIAKVEVRAVYGGGSEVTYVTRSGKRIKKND